ncbi:tubulin-folding cofactor E isoform X2 [Phoenix dactylifera]|uniref:Tubulin-folding cofactor E isoform X2 n=1 Tax=Phoenix dactylifera TaxID=42345 RepID=A0A8B8IZN8_PHODC|nr:tubulin-folding cofactor E isoform X2 [Phoenix dactylifera]XP_026656555.2 tubulin-folding cofactor E isoform X2 [Phoenix dactylifera]XP_026656556.2 tubulin-folding cofactor E isoform X2 [Phoenix dactylifera]
MDESSEKLPASGPNGNDGASPAAEDAGFRVGQRVHAIGNPRRTGTVRYVGEVEGHVGEWVGVDWDDGEGKHDGSVNGVRYFAAAGERSASFVRPKNLSAGISFIEALHLRYRGDSTKEEEDEMYVLSTSNKRVSIQLVGKNKVQEKLKHFEELRGASVSYLGVSFVEPSHEINALVPNLEELDLTGNLLSKWQDIGSLCDALPALGVLNLTNNFMEHDVEELPLLKIIRTLVLNNCGMAWKEVEILKESLPAVEELHLMANKLRTIMPAPSVPVTAFVPGFDNLRLINLEDNCIDSWDEILKLSYLRSLEQLHLNKNKLKHIYYPANHPCPGTPNNYYMQDTSWRPFENLQCLLLGCNEIEDLASIDSLNSFPSLMDIRLSENPIVDPAQGGVPRFVLVARLAKAKILNGSEVSPRERKESEIRYVRLVMAKMQSDDSEEIKQLHPRFAELKALHGIEDEKPSCGISGPQKMASGLLCVTLKCVGASIGEKQPLKKKIPPSTTVGKLKVLCESFFKLKGIQLRLFLQEERLQFRCTNVA